LEFHFVKKWKPRLYEKNAILTYAGLGTWPRKGGHPTWKPHEVTNC
jgi:hypothetical protein